MKRFADATRRLGFTKDQRKLACYAFSLLVNSNDLCVLTMYYELVVVVFLSPNWNEEVKLAAGKIEALLRERPKNKEEINILLKNWGNNDSSGTDSNDTSSDNDSTDVSTTESPKKKAKKGMAEFTDQPLGPTIKASSPFTMYFNQKLEEIGATVDINQDESTIGYKANRYYLGYKANLSPT